MIKTIFEDTRFQILHGTEKEWDQANPILAEGEEGVVIDNGKASYSKIGNGRDAWKDLPIFHGPPGVDGKDGIDGRDGIDGLNGKDGKDGRDGDTVIGPPGLPGKSIKGDRGEKGDPGESITGPRGPPGTDGQSIQGEKGEPGPGLPPGGEPGQVPVKSSSKDYDTKWQYPTGGVMWTGGNSGTQPDPATAIPLIEAGLGAVGTSEKYAREDHIHPEYGGGASALDDLTDVVITAPIVDGQALVYDDATSKWINETVAGAGDVIGPAGATGDNFASYNGATGKIIKDSGSKATDFANAAHNHDLTYLGIAAKAADADKLDNHDSSYFAVDADVVHNALFNADTIIAAVDDNVPAAVTVAEQTLVGRITGGHIDDLSVATVKTLLAYTAADVGAATTSTKLDDFATPDNNTDLDANTTNHGLLLKATAPAAGLINVVGIANGETSYANKALFDTTNPADNGTAGPGTAVVAARRDHVHATDTSRAPSNPLATDTLWDAAGDLVVGTGSNTAGRLAKGTTLQILHMKSDASTVEWTAPPTELERLTAVTDSATFATSSLDDGMTGDTDLGVGYGIISRIRLYSNIIMGQRVNGLILINDANGLEPADTSLAYDGLSGTLMTKGAEGTGDYLWIENELCRVADGTSTPLTLVRGCGGTKAAFHDDNVICYTANDGIRLRLFKDSDRKPEDMIAEWSNIFTGVWTTDAAVTANDTFLTLTASPAVLSDFGRGSVIVIDPAGTIEYAMVQKVTGAVSGTTWDDSIRVEKALGAHDNTKSVYRVCELNLPIPFKFATGTTLYWTLYIDQLAAETTINMEFVVEGVS